MTHLVRLLESRRRKMFVLAALLLAFSPTLSLVSALTVQAQAMPWDGPIQQIEADLQGPTALALGTILIVGAGIGLAVTHQAGAFKLLWLVVGLGIALDAPKLLAMIQGSGSGFEVPLSLTTITNLATQVAPWIH